MVTVFRDARHILTAPVGAAAARGIGRGDDRREPLAAAQHGHEAAHRPGGEHVLRVDALSAEGAYDDVSFQVRVGEIVGLAGAAGSGRTEVAETVVGLRTAGAGAVEIAGQRPRPGSVSAALAAGAGFVPQDRHDQGFVPEMSIADNSTLTIPERLGPSGFISGPRRDALARSMIKAAGDQNPRA